MRPHYLAQKDAAKTAHTRRKRKEEKMEAERRDARVNLPSLVVAGFDLAVV